jgi:hypothetical protein
MKKLFLLTLALLAQSAMASETIFNVGETVIFNSYYVSVRTIESVMPDNFYRLKGVKVAVKSWNLEKIVPEFAGFKTGDSVLEKRAYYSIAKIVTVGAKGTMQLEGADDDKSFLGGNWNPFNAKWYYPRTLEVLVPTYKKFSLDQIVKTSKGAGKITAISKGGWVLVSGPQFNGSQGNAEWFMAKELK